MDEINTGGEKVFPLEAEEVLLEHPKVKETCVIGVPNEDWGSIVRAVVIPKDGLVPGKDITAGEVMDFCKEKVAGYKRPRSVVFAKTSPISPVGKVLRAQLRELYGKPDTKEAKK